MTKSETCYMKTHTATRRTQNSLCNIVIGKTLLRLENVNTNTTKLKILNTSSISLTTSTQNKSKNKFNNSHNICIHQSSQTSLIMKYHNGKVTFPLCLIKHHAMNANGRGEDTTPCVLNLVTQQRYVVSFMYQ